MKIFVDADACPVVDIVEDIATKYNIPVTLLCDTNHVLTSDYSEVIVVGAGGCRGLQADKHLSQGRHSGYSGLWRGCNGAWQRCVCNSSVGQMVYG